MEFEPQLPLLEGAKRNEQYDNTPENRSRLVVDVPDEIPKVLGIAEGSIALLHANEGRLEVEVLPPPSKELVESVGRTYEQFKEAFDEMKRLGD